MNAIRIYLDETVVSGSKSKIAAGLLPFLLVGFGVHKFYLGCKTTGIIMLVVFLFKFILLGLPSLIIAVIALFNQIKILKKYA